MSQNPAFITTDAVGGVWTYSTALARGFAARGMSCVLAVLGPDPDPEDLAAVTGIPGCTVMTTGLPLEWILSDRVQLDSLIAALAVCADRAEASTVHLHAPALAANGWSVPTVTVAHSCMATWWDAVRGGELPRSMAWHARATADGLHASDVVVAPTQAFTEQLRHVYGGSLVIDVVRNGVADVQPGPARRDRHVLTAGRLWDDGKNVAVLDRAAMMAPIRIAAAGPCRGPDGSDRVFKNLGLLGTLRQPALRHAMAEAAVFASPARYEPFGLTVLEAAQSATPLVLSNIPTFRELWSDAAIFVAPDDPSAWARALSDIIDDEPLRVSLGRAAQARASDYTASKMVDATAKLHRGLRPAVVHAT